MKKNRKLLYVCWAAALLVILLITLRFRGEFTEFYGIAETREIAVNSESAVEIRKIHIVQGQAVSKGDLLIELYNPKLTRTINETTHEIEELKAQMASRVSEISYKIKQLQVQADINPELTQGLTSLNAGRPQSEPPDSSSPIAIQIESLRKALQLETHPMQIRIDMRLRELELMLEEKNNLFIFAQVSGIIGSVRCKAGEQISPFKPLLTLHPKAPSYVRGYVHEFVYTQISVGQPVRIISMADPTYSLVGEVVGVGAKIIEYPRRLRRMLEVQVYRREIQIKIPKNNRLLLGEKVLISTLDQPLPSELSVAGSNLSQPLSHTEKIDPAVAENNQTPALSDIMVNKALKNIAAIEASGAIYLPDLKKLLLISDTTRKHRPVLYLMDTEGTIEDEITIQGLKKIDDMEAITTAPDGTIYIACSQSPDRCGRTPGARKRLLRLTRDRTYLKLLQKVSLLKLLKQAAAKDLAADWTRLLSCDSDACKLNVEGMFYQDGHLYLGLKSPLLNAKAAIIKISHINRVFEEKRLAPENVCLWQTFDLKDRSTGAPSGISDLFLLDRKLYILAYTRGNEKKNGERRNRAGSVWCFDLESKTLSHLRQLDKLKPEGLTFNPNTKEFSILFDHGPSQPSKLMRLKEL
ncbi:MAG: HlyD family efflux transporter periplasmic adaptor subunit [bacterium]|nr:HlyD family efflux transporter periplasmic adaptor subunit [bacterium]